VDPLLVLTALSLAWLMGLTAFTFFALYKARVAIISLLERRIITSSNSTDLLDAEISAIKARIEDLESKVRGA
jgi:hypothetical protein